LVAGLQNTGLLGSLSRSRAHAGLHTESPITHHYEAVMETALRADVGEQAW